MAKPSVPSGPVVKIPLATEGVNTAGAWKTRVEASQAAIDRVKPDWDRNQERYLVKKSLAGAKDDVIVPKDYANVEQKKAQLAYRVPEIQLEPMEPLASGMEDAVAIFEAVVNYQLGPHGVNAEIVLDEVLSDALCSSGIFGSKIAYEGTFNGTKQVPIGQQPDPNWQPPTPQQQQPGTVLGLNQPTPQPPMVPQLATVPNLIAEHYVWERISPAKLLIPEEFTGSDYDKAAWLGFEFVMPFNLAKRAFKLADDFKAFASDDDRKIGRQETATGDRSAPKRVRGWEIWYKASLFDDAEVNPDRQRVLVLIDGLKEPVKHENSPYQVDLPTGQIGGMEGFPVHIGALRYVSDLALPPSDCQMSRYQVDEVSKGRTQMIRQRERSIPLRIADLQGIGGEEGLAKIEKNIWQSIIPLENMDPTRPPIVEVARAQFPRENFEFDQIANRDIAETWALDSNQRGVTNDTARTATELQLAQQSSNIRLDKERSKFLSQYVARGAAKLGALLQQFSDQEQWVPIVGADGAQRLQAWDKSKIQGKYLYKVRPNSSLRLDVAQERSQALQMYNLLAPSPFINQQELVTQTVRKFDLDATKLIVQPQPKPAEVPKVSFAFNGTDLNPANPAFPIVLEILRQGGIQVDDQAIGAAQRAGSASGLPTASAVPHGSPQPPPPAQTFGAHSMGPVNKHQEERTGERTGPKIGAAA